MQTTTSTTHHSIQELKGTQCIERSSKITSTHYEHPEEATATTSPKCSKTIVMLFTPLRHTREGIFVNAEIIWLSLVHSIPFISLVWERVTRLLSVSMNGTSSNHTPSIETLTLYPLSTTDSMESQCLNRSSFCNMESMWLWDIKQKIIGIGIDYWMVEWMWVYVQTMWHYWLSQNTQNVSSMNIEEHHPLSHTWGHVCRHSLAYWWACYRVSWRCNCFHCCWICTTLMHSIYFGWLRS